MSKVNNVPAGQRKYKVGDRVTVITIFEEEQAQPREYLFKTGEVTEATDETGWTRVKFNKKSKNEMGWFFKGIQLVPVNDGVIFAAFMTVIKDYQRGMELETCLAQNGFKLIT